MPDTALTNDDIAKFVDTNDAWIRSRTGIRQRHKLASGDNASDLGFRAAQAALSDAGIGADALTHVMVATCTPDMLSPSVACLIAGRLGAENVMAFDVGAACSGFLYGLSLCQALLLQTPAAHILFVCTEALTRRVNWNDRSTCVLFGDAATACLLSARHDASLASLEDVICMSDGGKEYLIHVGGGTSCAYELGEAVDERFFITMHGRETYKHAVRNMTQVCEDLLARNNLTVDDVQLLVPHQANLRIIEAVGARLKISDDKVFTNVAQYGNTSSASIPLAVAEAMNNGRIRPGDRVLTTAFGAGLTWGAALLRF